MEHVHTQLVVLKYLIGFEGFLEAAQLFVGRCHGVSLLPHLHAHCLQMLGTLPALSLLATRQCSAQQALLHYPS